MRKLFFTAVGYPFLLLLVFSPFIVGALVGRLLLAFGEWGGLVGFFLGVGAWGLGIGIAISIISRTGWWQRRSKRHRYADWLRRRRPT